MRGHLRILVLFVVAVFFLSAGDAKALPPDPAARGLDVYLHVPTHGAPGSMLMLAAEAFGFPVITRAVPLPDATLEVGWDPESLGAKVPSPTVTTTTDAQGRARLAIEVPHGKPGSLELLVAIRHGGHARTRSVKIARVPAARVEVHTADTRVVPTSTITAWIRVSGISDEPLADTGVVVALSEGGVARHKERLVTDRGGMAMARVPIPRIDEPVWSWTLSAEAEIPGAPPTSITLTPREENPGTPKLEARWSAPPSGAGPGEGIPFTIRVRDATGQPLIDHAVTYWIGARGVVPPKSDDDWTRVGTTARTDGAGEITGVRDAPTLVKSSGTSLLLLAKTKAEGHVLTDTHSAEVGVFTATASLTPEAPAVVPGLTQRLLLRVNDGRGDGIAGRFAVAGDGLSTTVTTDDLGEAELTWNAPEGVGASRNVGTCAGGVAAAVTIKPAQPIPTLRAEGFSVCVPVDRDAAGIVHVEPNIARPGEKVRIELARAPHARAKAVSAVARPEGQGQSSAVWLDASASAAELLVPADGAPGAWDVTLATAEGLAASRVVSTRFVVVSPRLPRITATRVGGRATPGGAIEVDVKMDDGHGHPLPGAVSAVVVDAFGGGHANVGGLDTRSRLCGVVGVEPERCDAVLERAPETDALRRALLGNVAPQALLPANDPGAHATDDLRKAFQLVLKSLEGAVFEAAKNPQSLIDVRRRENGRWRLNPELLSLVTDAMSEPPLTPGGEPLTLPDLVAIDPQVSFDVVARRVTRLKLFRILVAIRDVRARSAIDPHEPMFQDPNALVRRLVRSGALAEDVLLDPWGGTLQFVKGNGPPEPFLSVVRGFELRAPGPDGVVGTADDVRDPFERVLRSGTPYAVAVDEDRLVDAKFDMLVADETVRAWTALFEELTGTQLGDGGLGLSGVGEGGGGRGEGIGLGNVGTVGHGMGSGRGSSGIANGNAWWSAPTRTNADGTLRMTIPLGDAETTWRIAFIGAPDGTGTASTTLDVASDLPLSLKVIGGAKWTDGDVVDVRVAVRNRTDRAVNADVSAVAEGAAVLEGAASHRATVPARGARALTLRVRARSAGEGRLVLTARSKDLPEDVLHHAWAVMPAGERRVLTRTRFVEHDDTLSVSLDEGYRLDGTARVVLERGYEDPIDAALSSLTPEDEASTLGHVDALETALRVQRWATTKTTARRQAIAAKAADIARRAEGRYASYAALDGQAADPLLRARVLALVKRVKPKASEEDLTCPDAALAGQLAILDIEPPPSVDVPPCWAAATTDLTNQLMTSTDAVAVARALFALVERPHHATVAARLAIRLRVLAGLRPSGDIDGHFDSRADRALVLAALLRTSRLGVSTTPAPAIFAKLASLRDVNGGYGSSSATLAVVTALLASQLEGHGVSHVRLRAHGIDRSVDVAEDGRVVVPLGATIVDVALDTSGPGVVARFERPVLRGWSRPPPIQSSPVNLEVVWPSKARAESVEPIRILVRAGVGKEVDVRLPLPPGVSLAAPTKGVSQLQGALLVRMPLSHADDAYEVPLRFGLAGSFSVPESTARLTRSPSAPAVAPARTLVVVH